MLARILLIVFLLWSCNEASEPTSNSKLAKTVKSSSQLEVKKVKTGGPIINPAGQTVKERINPPAGFQRILAESGTFGHYLQNFPVKEDGTKVLLFDGREKYRQDVHAAILDIDVGKRDLQQCADAIMRLRAEHLWQSSHFADIHFNFTNGFRADYQKWRAGQRIRVQGNKVDWVNRAAVSESYTDFRKYLTMVFSYAGTLSLDKELKSQQLSEIAIGDVLIQGGSPGHAIIVIDKAMHEDTGEVLVLFAQSYMPAQDIHILRNPNKEGISPWYSVAEFEGGIDTPEWGFAIEDLKRF